MDRSSCLAPGHGADGHGPPLGQNPVVIPAVVAALVAALFAQAFVRLRRRGRADHAGWDRAALFAAALALALVALYGPLDRLAEHDLLSAHMLQHVLIGDAAPALGLVALRGPLLFFFLPAPALGALARTGWIRATLRFLGRPRVAFALWSLNLGVWHVPALYELGLRSASWHYVEHACFFGTALLFWYPVVQPFPSRPRFSMQAVLNPSWAARIAAT